MKGKVVWSNFVFLPHNLLAPHIPKTMWFHKGYVIFFSSLFKPFGLTRWGRIFSSDIFNSPWHTDLYHLLDFCVVLTSFANRFWRVCWPNFDIMPRWYFVLNLQSRPGGEKAQMMPAFENRSSFAAHKKRAVESGWDSAAFMMQELQICNIESTSLWIQIQKIQNLESRIRSTTHPLYIQE